MITAEDIAATIAAQQEELAWVESVLQRARERAYHHRLWGWGKGTKGGESSSRESSKMRSRSGSSTIEDVLGAVAWVGLTVWSWLGDGGGGVA